MANEKRLIDANKTMNSIVDLLELEWGYDGIREDVQQIFENAETVDAVPVVRCRECVHWGDQDGKLKNSDGDLFARCKIHNFLIDGRHTGWCPTENDFCSYGELKEGDD